MLGKLISGIFAADCLLCNRPGKYVCDKCERIFFERFSEEGHVRGMEHVLITYRYNKAIEYLWKQSKHEGCYSIASFLGRLEARTLMENALFRKWLTSAVFVPVPISSQKLFNRGFNQVDYLIQGISQELKDLHIQTKPYLHRRVNTTTQIGKNKQQRIDNLRGGFAVVGQIDPAKTYVVVDDVTTTGSTLQECAAVLKKAGAKRIDGLVFAKP
jgi:ComF family protein